MALTRAYPCDVTDEAQLDATLEAIRAELGAPKVLVHNAVGGAFGNFLETDPQVLNRNFQVNTMALLYLARRLAPAMIAAGAGAIVATGNTAGFAPTKAAQRILAETLARELGPKGVHVAYVLIDAVIDLECTRKRWPYAPDDFFITPATIAEEAGTSPTRSGERGPSTWNSGRLTVDIFGIQYSSETPSVLPERSRRSGEVEGPQAVGFDFPLRTRAPLCLRHWRRQDRLRLRWRFAQGTLSPNGLSPVLPTVPHAPPECACRNSANAETGHGKKPPDINEVSHLPVARRLRS